MLFQLLYYFKIQDSTTKLATLQKLKINNEIKFKKLKGSLNIDEIKTIINNKKQEKLE